MAISTFDDYIGSAKQLVVMSKTGLRTTVANIPFSLVDIAGNPGAGTLAVGNTANGLVPAGGPSGSQTAGYPLINFTSGLTYVSIVDFGNSVASRLFLYDRLFHCGAYAFNAATTLASQPSYSGRLPGAPDYTGTQIWAEGVTTGTGIQSVAVQYTDQAGNTGHTTGAISAGVALSVGKLWQLPLAAGDTGVSKIEKVTGTVATVGTFNVFVARPLWSGRIAIANSGDVHGLDRTGLPQIFNTSALQLMVLADGTSSGQIDVLVELANK